MVTKHYSVSGTGNEFTALLDLAMTLGYKIIAINTYPITVSNKTVITSIAFLSIRLKAGADAPEVVLPE